MATHDWSRDVDGEHLAAVRADPGRWAPDGVAHLLAEVLAYADDEAQVTRAGRCVVVLAADGSVSVADSGRGTQTRVVAGAALRKPVVPTKDLRFFDTEPPVLLPTGRARRGMSVVAALSTRLVHTNRRAEGAWRQVYEHGVPVGGLEAVEADGTTGTTVRFWPDPVLGGVSGRGVARVVSCGWGSVVVEVVDLRGS